MPLALFLTSAVVLLVYSSGGVGLQHSPGLHSIGIYAATYIYELCLHFKILKVQGHSPGCL